LSAIHPTGANVTVVEEAIFHLFSDKFILARLHFLFFHLGLAMSVSEYLYTYVACMEESDRAVQTVV
jgi:hypothetical protein